MMMTPLVILLVLLLVPVNGDKLLRRHDYGAGPILLGAEAMTKPD